METLIDSGRKVNKNVWLTVAAVAGLLVCTLLLVRYTGSKGEPVRRMVVMEPVTLPNAIAEDDLRGATGILRERLFDLRRLQQGYNTAAALGKDKPALDILRQSILLAEESLRASIDSSWISAITDRNADSSQLKVIASYKSSLDSIRMLNSTLNAATVNSDFVPDRQAFIKLQDELMEKTNKVALLESTIEVMQKQAASTGQRPDIAKPNTSEVTDPVALENKISELAIGNQRLQLEVERLKRQALEESKNNTAEQILLSKNTALQQKVNSINAELQLVRVDCNLSRVDATQIISNSKQRKQLLSEASGILTSLSSSSDADIRNKVKEKVVRLNQVAANTRD